MSRAIMVLGCTSDAGKSLIATGMCRWLSRQGLSVAPFKAQNMSNNARVVDGGEIGVAQWLQAKAARVAPRVAMNPVLVKPEADTRSQVIINGRPSEEISRLSWSQRAPFLWDAMADAYDELSREFDVVVIEGAGSPAEINLVDLVNNRIIEYADATGLLVTDIDRGGAFAHLYGTWSLVPESTRNRLEGFVLNKFRGDASLLEPAPSVITERTGMANFGVMPMLSHHLPDEEGATVRASAPSSAPTVVMPRFPFGSNLDEFYLLAQVAHVRWVTAPEGLEGADFIMLPGSKHVASDLTWLRESGLADAIIACNAEGVPLVGVCGGCQMLGERIEDPDGVEGGSIEGLALLPIQTMYEHEKVATQTEVALAGLPGHWGRLNGLSVTGYEIRHGRTSSDAAGIVATGQLFAADTVLGTTVHGLFENQDVLERLFGQPPRPVLEETFDHLADAIAEHLDVEAISGRLERTPEADR